MVTEIDKSIQSSQAVKQELVNAAGVEAALEAIEMKITDVEAFIPQERARVAKMLSEQAV